MVEQCWFNLLSGALEWSVTWRDKIMKQDLKYLIYKDGTTINALNCDTNAIDYTGTNASTVINGALTAMTDGGKIYLRSGDYDTATATLTISNQGTIFEMDQKARLIPSSGTNDMLTVNASDVIVKGLRTNGSSGGGWGINVTGSNSHIYIKDCFLYENPTGGIQCGINTSVVFIYDNYIYNYLQPSTNSGIYLYYCSDKSISHNNIVGMDYDGIASLGSGAGSTSIIGNHLDSNGEYGLYIKEPNGVTVAGNVIFKSHKHGVYVSAPTAGTWGNVAIVGNNIFDNGTDTANTYDGIFVTTTLGTLNDMNISGNVCTDYQVSKTQRYGITINTSSVQTCNVISNTVSGNVTGGINIVSAGTGLTVKHNVGFDTEANIQSATFAIDSTGLKTVTTAHGLDITPAVSDCQVSVVSPTQTDWAYNLLYVDSTSSSNVVAKINVSTASVTAGATARLGIRTGYA